MHGSDPHFCWLAVRFAYSGTSFLCIYTLARALPVYQHLSSVIGSFALVLAALCELAGDVDILLFYAVHNAWYSCELLYASLMLFNTGGLRRLLLW